MPGKPLRPCAKSGCRNLTTNGYCDEHRKDTNREYNLTRDERVTRFYKSRQWEMTRKLVLVRDHGLCQMCLKHRKIVPASLVDHIIPVRVNWSLRLNKSNLQSLCVSCHNAKTAEDKRKYGNLA
ncbi:HNH endonuclease signature motif containing protein [Weizmannia coagulans]|nr:MULTISPECIES: HNH endonuclease signature motif containing protein [Heyndrickxia]ATW83115.1 HNH endonuclease [Heyndrickxia coagulans]KGB28322.1 HNH endonuclease [Heyndrickxia coagulans]KXT22098.1 HNH endonuclease [Heyndrickxia coagulans]MBT2193761.1 HNH endonuclease [Heyndrickxia coagulans]MBT2236198.1 HNH endonuclease [Heyndrickxia coagulans]